MAEIKEKDTIIDVSPDMQMYNLLESYPYTFVGALNEYIDNSIAAFQKAKKDPLKELPDVLTVDISISSETIVIKDDGPGILSKDIQRAMKPASVPEEKTLSEYGIGMKAASMWFGKSWILESHPLQEEGFKIEFDLDRLLKNNQETVVLQPVENQNKSGLKIVLKNLSRDIDENQARRAWEKIQETYQLFTSRTNPEPILKLNFKFKGSSFPKKDFAKLIVSNEPLVFPECRFKDGKLYAIGEPIVWRKKVEFQFEEKIIKGFISLGRESSQKSNPGIRLFRYGRLIKGMESQPNRPEDLVGTANKAAPSRFYAELHLDGQRISNSKGEFVFDDYLFIETLKEQEWVSKFLEQAENYRSKKSNPGEYLEFKTWEEFETKMGAKSPRSPSVKPGPDKNKEQKVKPNKPKPKKDAITTLKSISAPKSFLLLDDFIKDAIYLYSIQKIWAFCLVYRAILEVGIIDKIKEIDEDKYVSAKEKSIVALYKFLQSNSNLIPDQFETLKRVLRETSKDKSPFIGILNITSHGRYTPTKKEVDDMLKNTQQLLEWAFDREE